MADTNKTRRPKITAMVPSLRLPQFTTPPVSTHHAETRPQRQSENVRPLSRSTVTYPSIPTPSESSIPFPRQPSPPTVQSQTPPSIVNPTSSTTTKPFRTDTANVGRRRANAVSLMNSPARRSHSEEMSRLFESARKNLPFGDEQARRLRVGGEASLLHEAPRRATRTPCSYRHPTLRNEDMSSGAGDKEHSRRRHVSHDSPYADESIPTPSLPLPRTSIDQWLAGVQIAPAPSEEPLEAPPRSSFSDTTSESGTSKASSTSSNISQSAHRSRIHSGDGFSSSAPGLKIPARLPTKLTGPTRFRPSPLPSRRPVRGFVDHHAEHEQRLRDQRVLDEETGSDGRSDLEAANGKRELALTPDVQCYRKGQGPLRARCRSYFDEDVLPELSPKVGSKMRMRDAVAGDRDGGESEHAAPYC